LESQRRGNWLSWWKAFCLESVLAIRSCSLRFQSFWAQWRCSQSGFPQLARAGSIRWTPYDAN